MEAMEMQLHSFDLFDTSWGDTYIDSLKLFYAYFKIIPSIKSINNLHAERLQQWIETERAELIVKKYSWERYGRRLTKMKRENTIYVLSNKLMLQVSREQTCIAYAEAQHTIAQQLLNEVRQFGKREKKTREIYLVTSSPTGFNTTDIKIKKPRFSVGKLYNDDLPAVHTKILRKLKQKDKSGLILLHGLPGTGKSTYIRFLINCVGKKVIFMPPRLAGNLDEPSLANFLIKNMNSVFVIEDAEELISSREHAHNSGISMLLNLTDGLLGESLGIQVIATFNTNITKIDKALLRKGRLMALYEFKPLCVEKSKQLLEEIGINDHTVNDPMTLAEIFNTGDESFHFNNNTNQRQAIGFLSSGG